VDRRLMQPDATLKPICCRVLSCTVTECQLAQGTGCPAEGCKAYGCSASPQAQLPRTFHLLSTHANACPWLQAAYPHVRDIRGLLLQSGLVQRPGTGTSAGNPAVFDLPEGVQPMQVGGHKAGANVTQVWCTILSLLQPFESDQ
jgi:hypothetical protein